MAERSVVVRIRAEIGDFRRQMAEATRATQQLGQQTQTTSQQASTSLGRMVQSANQHSQAWESAGGTLLKFGAAVAVGVGLAIKSYADFDKAMSEVKAATHASASDMDALREAAIRAGADTAYSAREAALGIAEMAKAGIQVKDILNGGLDGALSLAAAGGMEVADAAELSATALATFGLKGNQVSHVADLLAAGAGKAQGSVHDMGMALKQAALVADSTGLSIEETTGGLAAFANAGLLGSDAGTSLKTMLASLTPNSKEAREKMAELGFSAVDAQGSFVGLDQIAGNLRKSMGHLSEAERAAAMETIFGSDAVRAATVLYEEGADGINKWIDKVDEAGYAAVTAGIKQDNLAGDFEKLGGSLDSVLLKSGSGANDVLRDLVQSAESFVDAIGDIPGPVLEAALGIAGATAGFALLGGAFLTLTPKIMDGIGAFRELNTRADGTSRGLGKVAKAAGIASVALLGLQVAGQIANSLNGPGRSYEEFANKILIANNAGEKFSQTFDADFLKNVNAGGEANVHNLTDLFKVSDQDDFMGFLNNTMKGLTGFESQVHRATDALGKADEVIAGMVKGGNSEVAASTFKKFAESADAAGLSNEKLFDRFPEYRDALLGQAEALGQSVSDSELYAWALGDIPPKIAQATEAQQNNVVAAQAQAEASAAAAEALAEIGLNADGTVASLSKLLDAMFATGIASMSARDAEAKYQEVLDGVKTKTEEVLATQNAQNQVLLKNKSGFDLSTEAGRAANGVYGELQQSAINTTKAMAENGATQPELAAKLKGTYDSLVTTAMGFGMGEAKAKDMAREALGIPKGVDVNTAIQNYADSMAKLHNVDATVKGLDGKTANVYVNTHETTFQKVVREHFSTPAASKPGRTGVGTVLAPGNKATGGAIHGPGTGTSDDIPTWLSNGEHVLTAAEVEKMGGQEAVYRFRQAIIDGNAPKFASGGAVERARRRREMADGRREFAEDYLKDKRRGNGYGTVIESQSSAESFADRLLSLADSGNVGAAAIRNLNIAAGRGEAGLRALHRRSDGLSASLEKAKNKLDDLQQVRNSVGDKLSGEFSLSGAVKDASFYSKGSMKGVLKSGRGDLARLQGFAKKLQGLQKKGYSGAVLQEVADMGSEEGTKAADILLAGTAAEVKELNGIYTSIDKAGDAAGIYVTNAMYKGGVNAAAGLVKGLESQQKAIEKQMLRIGLGMETALKKALGIRSPSRKAMAIANNFTGTLVDNLKAGQAGVAQQAAALGDALSIAPSKSMAGGYGAAMSVPGFDYGTSSAAAVAAGPTTHHWYITDQSNPVATAHEVARRQQSLEV